MEVDRGRRAAWRPPESDASGVLAKYAALVSSASTGAVTDPTLNDPMLKGGPASTRQ